MTQTKNITSGALREQMNQISEITTVEHAYTNVEAFENSTLLFGFQLPFTSKKFILIYDGKIKAGIDFKEATVEVNDKNVTVKLPKPKILSHDIYEDTLKVYDEQSFLFNPIKVKDINEFFIAQKQQKVSRAKENNLLQEANQNAKKH